MASSCVRFPKVQLRSPSDNFPSLDTSKEITINSYRFIKKRCFDNGLWTSTSTGRLVYYLGNEIRLLVDN